MCIRDRLQYVTNANFSVALRLISVRSVDINLTINGDFSMTRETLKLPYSTDVFIPDLFITHATPVTAELR